MKKAIMSAILITTIVVLNVKAAETSGYRLSSYLVEENSVNIDGFLTEPYWQRADSIFEFIQNQPFEGKPSTQRTVVKIMYDDKYIYIGFVCHDLDYKKINLQLNTRDNVGGEG
jgi:hypothetical protein